MTSDSDKLQAAPIASHVSGTDKFDIGVGRERLHGAIAPHSSYEGRHRFDPLAEWTVAEERHVVRITDLRLLSWLCLMVCLRRFV